jgi:hypothetical protein
VDFALGQGHETGYEEAVTGGVLFCVKPGPLRFGGRVGKPDRSTFGSDLEERAAHEAAATVMCSRGGMEKAS